MDNQHRFTPIPQPENPNQWPVKGAGAPISPSQPETTPTTPVVAGAAVTPADRPKNISLEESSLEASFTPLDVPSPVPAPSEKVEVQVEEKSSQLDAEKSESWESLLDNWIQEEFSHLFGGMLEGHPAEDLTEWVLEMLEKVSKLGEDEKVKIDHLKLFFSSVSGDVLRPFLTKHIAALMQEHKVGYSAAEVARWRNEFFDYFAKIIRYSAQGQNGVIPGLANDPERLTQEAMLVMKDWEKHVGKPEAREIYAELAEYWAANADQFEEQLKAVFEKLVTAQRL